MLTYTPSEKKPLPRSPEKPWLLLILTFMWLLFGIIGRDLWGGEETILYSYIDSILKTKNWLIPSIYDIPYLSSSPLYLWLGASAKFLFTAVGVPAYLSVRLLTLILMSASLLTFGIAAKNFLGRRYGRVAVLIMIGCVGIILFGHNISQLPLFFFVLALYSYAISIYKNSKVLRTSLCIALSWVIAFCANNIPCVLSLMLISITLPLHPQWRNNQYYLVLLVACIVFFPLASLWPIALYITNPIDFYTWLNLYSLGSYGGLALMKFSVPTWYYCTNIIWYAFPAWPLTIFSIIKLKSNVYKNPIYFLFLLWMIVGFLSILFQPYPENNQLILLMPPLVFLATSHIDTLPRELVAFLHWLGITTFGMLALFIWVAYIAINFELSDIMSRRSFYFNPLYKPYISAPTMLMAIIFTPIWIYAINRKQIVGRLTVTNWSTGVTFIWLLLMTLFLPWLDTLKSYRPLVAELENMIPESIKHDLIETKTFIDSNDLKTLINWNEYSRFKIQSSINQPVNIYQYHITLSTIPEFTQQHPNVVAIWSGGRVRKKNRVFIMWE